LEESMPAYSERYDAALALAARAHRHQDRKGSDVPYLVHPVHVSAILIRHGFPGDVAIAGLLHDVVEDQNVPLSEIEAAFGQAVADMVAALTERKRENEIERTWEIRKLEALDRLKEAGPDAVAVKAADVLHNTRTLVRQLHRQGPSAWSHYSRGPDASLWYARSVAAIARDRLGAHALVDELDTSINDLQDIITRTGDS
jgi:(p)ppGpp synthase/HD superfamily hydrolase